MTSSNPAHLAQDFGLIQSNSHSKKNNNKKKTTTRERIKGSLPLISIRCGSTDSLVDHMIIIFGIFTKIMH